MFQRECQALLSYARLGLPNEFAENEWIFQRFGFGSAYTRAHLHEKIPTFLTILSFSLSPFSLTALFIYQSI